ncbi:hypothetical protein TYRP_023148 [Tyrophagus putrescentiae]|nr:hypothetical protein TYRP_023148 [Tyrophagus putrescentiae]
MEALCKLKVWLRENLNNLVVEKSDDEIDSDLMTILLNIKDILKNPAFWFTFFGSIATELTENCDKTFEVTANWLHYATAVLMEKKKGQLLAIDHLKKYLSFLINVVKIFENMVEYFNENSENKNNIPDLFIKRLDVFTFLQVYTCIVLEKMEISLKSYIKKHSFTLPQAKSIFHQLLKVLAVLSEIKYVHGDLKTGNVMIKRMPNENDPEVSIKVIDFGTARCIENGYCGKNIVKFPGVEPFDLNDNESDRCYTPGYAAPEWLLDLNGKDKTYDLWNFCLLALLKLVIGGLKPNLNGTISRTFLK